MFIHVFMPQNFTLEVVTGKTSRCMSPCPQHKCAHTNMHTQTLCTHKHAHKDTQILPLKSLSEQRGGGSRNLTGRIENTNSRTMPRKSRSGQSLWQVRRARPRPMLTAEVAAQEMYFNTCALPPLPRHRLPQIYIVTSHDLGKRL